MRQKAVLVERDGYTKEELARIERVLRKMKLAQKDPEFIKAAEEFVKETT